MEGFGFYSQVPLFVIISITIDGLCVVSRDLSVLKNIRGNFLTYLFFYF